MAPKKQILYGSLYLDRGERMDKVKEQLYGMRKKTGPFFFDVIYGPGQEELADEYVERVKRRASGETFESVSVGKTFAATPEADPRSLATAVRKDERPLDWRDARARVAEQAPDFIRMIENVKGGSADLVVMTVMSFVHEPELLRDALLVAYHEGVPIDLAPES